ncbi:MAG TPA: hypothetical protein VFZ42_17080 [Chitinophagaceae bacterium]
MLKLLGRKLAVVALIAGSTIAAFATLGDGNKKSSSATKPNKSILSNKTHSSNNFSLRSGYEFRGNQVINTRHQKFVNLHTTLTYRKGTTNYILPVQKKVFLDKVILNDDLLRNRRAY